VVVGYGSDWSIQVGAEVWVHSLAQEPPYAAGEDKKKKEKKVLSHSLLLLLPFLLPFSTRKKDSCRGNNIYP